MLISIPAGSCDVCCVQNFAVRLLGKRKYGHITPTLKEFKILPVLKSFGLRRRCSDVQVYAIRHQLTLQTCLKRDLKVTSTLTTILLSPCAALAHLVPVIPNSSRVDTFEHSLRNYFHASFLSNEVP